MYFLVPVEFPNWFIWPGGLIAIVSAGRAVAVRVAGRSHVGDLAPRADRPQCAGARLLYADPDRATDEADRTARAGKL